MEKIVMSDKVRRLPLLLMVDVIQLLLIVRPCIPLHSD